MDGESIPVIPVNIKNIGLMLPEGRHNLELVYHTPFMIAGRVISLIALVVFLLGIVIYYVCRKKTGENAKGNNH